MSDPVRRTARLRGTAGSNSASHGGGLGADAVVFWTFAVVALAFSVGLGRDPFERFYGPVPPVVVVVLASVMGAVSLRVLSTSGWLSASPPTLPGVSRAAAAGMALATLAVGFDNLISFPEDMNVAWPRSVLFYPAIAFVAEVVFHLAPLAAVIVVLRWRFDERGETRRMWITIAVVAGVETLFHTLDALGGPDRRLAFFVAPQLLIVGVCQLVTFRRHGLAALMSFRLGYYLVWHIVWGPVRLALLF